MLIRIYLLGLRGCPYVLLVLKRHGISLCSKESNPSFGIKIIIIAFSILIVALKINT